MRTAQELREAFDQSGDANVKPTTIDKALGIGMSPPSIVRRYAGLSRKAVQRQRDKRHEIQAAFEEARTTHARLAEEYCAGVRERLGRSRKAAFAAPKIAGSDKASELMAYRNALDRVSRITDTRTLSEMLARAETVGDAPPVRAVLYRSYELQSEALLGSYLEKYPEEQQTWETYMEAAEEHNTLETLGTSALTGVAEPESPQELGRQIAVTPRGVPSGEEA